jgi:membrane-bound ClpP family serine protease
MSEQKQKAGIFDIRFVIGGLLGVYGVILVLLGLFHASDEELARGDGLNINLWGGLGMLAVSIAFGVWAKVRPVVVPVEQEPVDRE